MVTDFNNKTVSPIKFENPQVRKETSVLPNAAHLTECAIHNQEVLIYSRSGETY